MLDYRFYSDEYGGTAIPGSGQSLSVMQMPNCAAMNASIP